MSDILVMSNDDQIYTTFGWDDCIDPEALKFPDGVFLFWFADGIESDFLNFAGANRVIYKIF